MIVFRFLVGALRSGIQIGEADCLDIRSCTSNDTKLIVGEPLATGQDAAEQLLIRKGPKAAGRRADC